MTETLSRPASNSMVRPRGLHYLICSLLIFVGGSHVQAQVPDPVGDHDNPADVVSVRARPREIPGQPPFTQIFLTFSTPVAAPMIGYIFMDLDRNPDTHAPTVTALPGIEAVGRFYLAVDNNNSRLTFFNARETVPVTPKYMEADVKDLSIGVPRSATGDEDLVFDFFVAVDNGEQGDAMFDRVPDAGVIDYSAAPGGVAKVPQPGDSSINIEEQDPRGDLAFPDLVSLEMKVVGDRLQIILTYNHGLDRPFPQNARLLGTIWFDLDQRLVSGFGNEAESPPTFGADTAIQFNLNPRSAFAPAVLSFNSNLPGRTTPKQIGFGLAQDPPNDLMTKRVANQLFFDVPLAILGTSSGEALVRVTSQSTVDAAMDAIPEAGAVLTSANRVRAPFNCTASPSTIADPDDPIPGDKNDELLGVTACLSLANMGNGDALLVQINYASVQPLADSATTQIFIDTDQNQNTGRAITNGDKTIGADYIVSFPIARSILGNLPQVEVRLTPATGNPLVYNQFVTVKGGSPGSVDCTLPLELLGRDDGNLDVMVETSRSNVRRDIAPDRGALPVKRP